MNNNNINLNFINNRQIFRANTPPPPQTPMQQPAPAQPQITPQANMPQQIANQAIQTAMMGGAENAAFIKDVMKFPSNFNAFIYIIQQRMTTAQLNAQINKHLLNMKGLSQTQAQILAQMNGINSTELLNLQGINKTVLAQIEASIKKLPISANGMINIADIASLITANGKDAITQLIISMANSAKSGLNNINQMKDAARLINASIAVAGQGDNAQTLKMLMLLYLPWLPLQQGVDFDLEISSKSEEDLDNSVLTIRIQTINFGEVIAVLTLESPSSIDINIQCMDSFPKDELTLRLNADNQNYSAQNRINYTTKAIDKSSSEKTTATINMSGTNEINPYLLLTAQQIIRHVVEIDKNSP
ncbi:hypothetical protein J6S88_00770 [bacterium]|nr:hypothetical protein [bacterium]